MKCATILVTGPGRSGTSFTTEILHRDLNVHMGSYFLKPDEFNKEGYWEDLPMADLSDMSLTSRMDYYSFQTILDRMLKFYNSQSPVWGWKDPRLCHTMHWFLPYLRNPLIVWCDRDTELMLKSKWWGAKRETWQGTVQTHSEIPDISSDPEYWITNRKTVGGFFLDHTDLPVLRIDFTQRRRKAEVKSLLADFLEDNGVDLEELKSIQMPDTYAVGNYTCDFRTLTVGIGDSTIV